MKCVTENMTPDHVSTVWLTSHSFLGVIHTKILEGSGIWVVHFSYADYSVNAINIGKAQLCFLLIYTFQNDTFRKTTPEISVSRCFIYGIFRFRAREASVANVPVGQAQRLNSYLLLIYTSKKLKWGHLSPNGLGEGRQLHPWSSLVTQPSWIGEMLS